MRAPARANVDRNASMTSFRRYTDDTRARVDDDGNDDGNDAERVYDGGIHRVVRDDDDVRDDDGARAARRGVIGDADADATRDCGVRSRDGAR